MAWKVYASHRSIDTIEELKVAIDEALESISKDYIFTLHHSIPRRLSAPADAMMSNRSQQVRYEKNTK